MQNLANQFLDELADAGSNIVSLSWRPPHRKLSDVPLYNMRDFNGHTWPNYAYCKGSIINAEGEKEVVAIPMREETWADGTQGIAL